MEDKTKVTTEQYCAPPPELGKCKAFRTFLCKGRTGASWAKILLFCLIFFAVLVGCLAAMLAVYYKVPKWQQEDPVLGFQPTPDPSNVENTLIYYKPNDKDSVLKWVKRLDEFLDSYRKKGSGTGENRVLCTPTTTLGENQVCDVPVKDFDPCTPENGYNYAQGGPCVFLKLNKIFNWKPKPYINTEDLPVNMPVDLKRLIRMFSGHPEENTVWVSCEGENPADVENIGPVHCTPQQGFPAHYFPFTNKEGYLSPLVAVFFEKPRTGVLINIECKAWAKNINYNHSMHFELMVDRD